MNSNYRWASLALMCLLGGYGCSTTPPGNTFKTTPESNTTTSALTQQTSATAAPDINSGQPAVIRAEADLKQLQATAGPAETVPAELPLTDTTSALDAASDSIAETVPMEKPVPAIPQPRQSGDTDSTRPSSPPKIRQSQRGSHARAKITASIQTGQLQNPSLTEVSGLAASRINPEVLFAINDSGNSATLYALSESGEHLAQWPVQARNRDWEDLATLRHDNVDYLVIGDTGDNLQLRAKSTLYLIPEPSLNPVTTGPLTPAFTLNFIYEDGPRNVEAFASYQQTIYLMSKEPVSIDGPSNSHIYELEIPDRIGDEVLVARHVADLPLGRMSFEGQLAASLAGVDLNQPTALDIDTNGKTAYILTYRHVLRVDREKGQSWPEAFGQSSRRIHAHNLGQAEALAAAPERAIFLTSENRSAPIWAIPLTPLL